MKKLNTLLVLLFSLFLVVSCQDEAKDFRKEKVFAGGIKASADTLNSGKYIYLEYCAACHGKDGKGKGVASKGMFPPPRDFTQGLYKFGLVEDGELPTDNDFKRIIKHGLTGTAMFPWDLQGHQLTAVIQYIKTFAPQVWEEKGATVGKALEMTRDPYGLAHKDSAIKRGKEVYYGEAMCYSCHRAYETKSDLASIVLKATGERVTDLDDDIFKVKPQESEYGYKTIPPDFTWHEVRTAKTVEEIYMRLSAGVPGSGMPAWRGTIEDSDIWAVAHYVKSLMDLKGTPERSKLIHKLGM